MNTIRTCSNCGHQQPIEFAKCDNCHIVFSKYAQKESIRTEKNVGYYPLNDQLLQNLGKIILNIILILILAIGIWVYVKTPFQDTIRHRSNYQQKDTNSINPLHLEELQQFQQKMLQNIPGLDSATKDFYSNKLSQTNEQNKKLLSAFTQSKALANTKFLESMISIYYSDHENIFPEGSNTDVYRELKKYKLVNEKDGDFNAQGEMIDPWGNHYVFIIPRTAEEERKTGYGVYSFGPNCQDEKGEGDDIISRTRFPITDD